MTHDSGVRSASRSCVWPDIRVLPYIASRWHVAQWNQSLTDPAHSRPLRLPLLVGDCHGEGLSTRTATPAQVVGLQGDPSGSSTDEYHADLVPREGLRIWSGSYWCTSWRVQRCSAVSSTRRL